MLLSQIKALVEGIRLELASIHEQIRAMRDASEAAQKARAEIPARLSELRVPADERAKSDIYRQKAHRQQVWLTWATWLAFIAAGIYAAIAASQLRQMKIATQASQTAAYAACVSAQISRNVLLEAQSAEADAHESAVATIYQAMAATESERAEMQMFLGKPEINDHEFGVGYGFKNAGKTAALGVRVKFRLVFIDKREDPDFRYPPRQSGDAYNGRAEPGTVATQGGLTHAVVIGPDGNNVIPKDSDRYEYNSGQKDLVFYANMTYRDIFGGYHWRTFCEPFHIFGTGLIKESGHPKCALYNDSDIGSGLVKAAPAPTKPPPLPEITCKLPE